MNCPQCGAVNPAEATHCGRCGAVLNAPPVQGPMNPYASPTPHYPPPGGYGTNDEALKYVVPIGVSPWAVAAGYLGLVSPICLGATGPFAIIFAVLAFMQIKKNPKLGGKVRAIVGIIFGAFGTLMLIGFLITMIGSMARV